MPFGEVGKRHRDAERRGGETLSKSHLNIPWQFIVVVGKLLHLSAKVLEHKACREIGFWIIVINAKIGGNRHCRIALIARIEEFHGNTTAPIVIDIMRICTTEGYITRRETTHHITFGIGGCHAAVAEILYACCPSAAVVDACAITGAHKVGRSHIAHIIQAHLMLKFRSEQSWVLLHEVNIVVD